MLTRKALMRAHTPTRAINSTGKQLNMTMHWEQMEVGSQTPKTVYFTTHGYHISLPGYTGFLS